MPFARSPPLQFRHGCYRSLSELDAEIRRLQDARAALAVLAGPEKRGPGRPKGTAKKSAGTKRTLSPEARAKIAAAQKKRWAEAKDK